MYDDNFGAWHDTDEQETRDFYHHVQRNSVTKECVDCGRKVRIMPQYEVCNSCADNRENGWGY